MPKVSVIVPNYNHAPYLAQRLDSILNQTFRDYELILLDDFSTDGSRDIIKSYHDKYPHIKVYLNDQNSGSPFRQWDFGVRHAQGGYVWIAESDDISDPLFLEEMVAVMEANPHVGLAYCDAMIIDEKGNVTASMSDKYSYIDKRRSSEYINRGKDEIQSHLCVFNTINNTSGVLFRKACYIDAGSAHAGMRYCGDWFLYLRILLASDIAYVAKPLNSYRDHSGSSSRRYYADPLFLEEMMRIYHFITQNVALPVRSKKRIHDEILRQFCTTIAKGYFPSRQVLCSMKKIVPFFELSLLRFILDHAIKKCLCRLQRG